MDRGRLLQGGAHPLLLQGGVHPRPLQGGAHPSSLVESSALPPRDRTQSRAEGTFRKARSRGRSLRSSQPWLSAMERERETRPNRNLSWYDLLRRLRRASHDRLISLLRQASKRSKSRIAFHLYPVTLRLRGPSRSALAQAEGRRLLHRSRLRRRSLAFGTIPPIPDQGPALNPDLALGTIPPIPDQGPARYPALAGRLAERRGGKLTCRPYLPVPRTGADVASLAPPRPKRAPPATTTPLALLSETAPNRRSRERQNSTRLRSTAGRVGVIVVVPGGHIEELGTRINPLPLRLCGFETVRAPRIGPQPGPNEEEGSLVQINKVRIRLNPQEVEKNPTNGADRGKWTRLASAP
mmetsp:Transcript_29702/g.55235  ORF Transcript_29702/g.55235 Transcript_29702/m.55235 type:complete len:353 (-) Transcript_29702:283-1341(-)